MELEVIGQTVKGRDIYMAKYISNPENPTVLFLTQQYGNEQLTTEGALESIKQIADDSIEKADTSFWDTLLTQKSRQGEEADE